MARLRRLVPALAALLAALGVVQTTDLVACADEALAAEHGETHADGLPSGGHPAPAPGDSHDDGHGHDEASFADCLCHVVFTSTAVAPDAAALPRRPARFAAFVLVPPAVEPSGLDHVPLG